jgi:copper/silver efflux system protein
MMTWAIRNPFIMLSALVLLAVAGWWSWNRIPVDAIPDLSDNQVIVWSEWNGKSPEDVDVQVTALLTRELQGLAGVTSVRGLSLTGSSYVYVIFDERRDLYDCRARVLERLAQMQALLPVGVTPRMGPDATAMGQIFAFTLQGPRNPEHKRFISDQFIVPALAGVAGVAEVAPTGGVVREYHIDGDPVKMEEVGVTPDMLMMAVKNVGRDVGLMSVEISGVETMLRGLGFVRSMKDVENIVIRGGKVHSGGVGVRVKDIATVSIGGAPRQGILADENSEQVGVTIAMRVGEDPSAVIRAIKQRLEQLVPTLEKEQLVAVPFYDRSRLIEETQATLVDNLIEECVVVFLVVFFFLLHARASLAIALVLPFGVLGTFLLMYLCGVGANLMTLAGIAIAIGVMVDFGIVCSENITQHLCDLQRDRAQGKRLGTWSPWDEQVQHAVITAANEVARPLITAAATTIIGFLPIFLLDDQAGRLFVPLAISKTMAISFAVVLGMLLVPLVCRFVIPPWQVQRRVALALAIIAGAGVGLWIGFSGIAIPRDHERYFIMIPGWIAGPLAGMLAGLLVYRFGREQLVDPEHNAVSRVIAVTYNWALVRLLRHKIAFVLTLALIASTGWLLGLGWKSLSQPLASVVAACGGDFRATRVDVFLQRLFPGMESSFLPPLDEGSLLFMPSLTPAAGIGETLRAMDTQNKAIRDIPEVEFVMGKMGRAETALDPAPLGMIETIVQLKPYYAWPKHDIVNPDGSTTHRARTLAEVREVLAALTDIPGVAPSWLQPIETRVVMLSTGIRSPIALQLLGHDHGALEQLAERIEPIISRVRGAADVQMQREGTKPYAELRLDTERLARFGISVEQVMQTMETTLGGMSVAWSVEGTKRYGVRLRYYRERRDDADEIDQVLIPRGKQVNDEQAHGAIPLGLLVKRPVVYDLALSGISAEAWLRAQTLSTQRNTTVISPARVQVTLPADDNIAQVINATTGEWNVREQLPASHAFTYTIGPMAIRSDGGLRTQYVLLRPDNRGEVELIADAESAIRRALADGTISLPAGVTYRWVGRYEQQVKAAETMTYALIISAFIMLVLIYLGTRSWLVTNVIISCNLTVTTAGGFIAIYLAGVHLTTAVAVGFLVLLGVMFNDSILLGSYLHDLFKTPPKDVADVHHRVFVAGLRRRRPALMTNCTTLIALIPILWSDGRGSEVMRPMVLPVVGGMIADFISLFSVPVIYAWWWERKLARGNIEHRAPE